jgi:serine/threonine-protein kinase
LADVRTSEGLLPESTLGQYEIRRWIGAGGMGDVYEAVHKGLKRTVAIKTLQRRFLDDETVVARFLREGQLSTRIRHPHIVDVTDVGMIGGMPCLVMELLEGESLGAVIKKRGALPVQELVELVLPIIGAVEAAHDRGILHRDLKPSNIFLSRAWNGEIVPKVLDFGISKMVEHEGQESLTADSAFVGTPHYASPELMQGDRGADARSDQYSIGVVLYEGSTGQKPLAAKGDNFVALALAACAGEFPPPRSINPELNADFEAVVLRAMALHRKERFTSMRALGEALLPFASERARLIWAPTFAKPSARDAAAMEQTAATGIVPHLAQEVARVNAAHSQPDGSVGGASLAPPVASPRKSYGIAIAACATIVALVGGSLAVVRYATSARATPPPVITASAAAPQPTTFDVSVAATPDDATFELDGVGVGKGTLAQTLLRDGRRHNLRISAAGYETVLVEFDDARPPPAQIVLRPTTTASPPTSASAQPSRPTHKGSDTRPRTDNIDPWQ